MDDKEILFEQMEEVRESGMTNMLDLQGVKLSAELLDLHELASYLEGIQAREYGHFLMVEFNNWKEEQLDAE